MPTCLIALGSNLGDRRPALCRALDLLAAEPGIDVDRRSHWYRTLPVGGPDGQDDFFNGAARLETSLEPHQMLSVLLRIENRLGRTRRRRWAPRTLDLDLLLYDDVVLETPPLVIPHPRMTVRRFVLAPAAEVASDMIHPTTGWTIGQLLASLDAPHHYVAIAGPIGAGKSGLARRLHDRFGGCLIAEHLDAEMLTDFYADPASRAWETEIRLLDGRARQLEEIAQGAPEHSQEPNRRAAFSCSDFWLHQSIAFAEVWLDRDRFAAFERTWRGASTKVAKPNLLIELVAPTDLLFQRIRRRGRPYERQLSLDQLERLRSALARRVEACRDGPVLRLDATDRDSLISEAEAAVAAMQNDTAVLQSSEAG